MDCFAIVVEVVGLELVAVVDEHNRDPRTSDTLHSLFVLVPGRRKIIDAEKITPKKTPPSFGAGIIKRGGGRKGGPGGGWRIPREFLYKNRYESSELFDRT